jgi:hypothetical protein
MLIRDKHSETSDQSNSSDLMKRAIDRNNQISYHHIRSVIILLAFTVLMAALTCLFAYSFDQISGISKVQTSTHVYTSTRLLTIQSSRISAISFVAKKI